MAKKYTNVKKLPADVKQLPINAQIAWMLKFNAHFAINKNRDESKKIAWEAVEQYYEKVDGKWMVKEKSFTIEEFLKTEVREFTKMSERKVVSRTYRSINDKQGNFELFIPLELDDKGLTKVFKEDNGELYVKGIATHDAVDKEDERIRREFIEENRPTIVGKNLFFDHVHDLEHTGGYVSEEYGKEGSLGVIGHLESPEWNSKVELFLKKKEHGTKFGFSIGGRAIEIKKVFNEEIGRYVNEYVKGIFTEVTITPFPAQWGTELAVGNLGKSLAKTLETMECEEEYEEVEELTEEEIFWEDYQKASSLKYESIEAKDAAKRLDSLWAKSNGVNSKLLTLGVIKSLRDKRKSLGLDSTKLYFNDFDKVIVTSITDALDAREAKDRFDEIYQEYKYALDDVVLWRGDLSKKDRIAAIKNLTLQLTTAVDELSSKMSAAVYVEVKAKALQEVEVEAMKKNKKKVEEKTVDETKEVIEEEVVKSLDERITEMVSDGLEKKDEKEEVKDEKDEESTDTKEKAEEKDEEDVKKSTDGESDDKVGKEEENLEDDEENDEEDDEDEKKVDGFVTKAEFDEFKENLIASVATAIKSNLPDKATEKSLEENSETISPEQVDLFVKLLNDRGYRIVGGKKTYSDNGLEKKVEDKEEETKDIGKELDDYFGDKMGIEFK